MSHLILSDTGPILHLHEIKRIYLLKIFKETELIVSNFILDEMGHMDFLWKA